MKQHMDPRRIARAPQRPRARAVAAGDLTEGRRHWAAVAACALAITAPLVAPLEARAGWPLESGAPVALGFGALYEDADGSATHSGVDLAASAGSSVCAPVAGRVRFVGRVPAPLGGTVLAATIDGEDCSITLLPLSSACVQAGALISEGETVGELADRGDDSSAGTHLHVGAKRGSLYIDPLSLIAAPPVPAEQTPEAPPAEPAGVEEQAGAGLPASAVVSLAAAAAAAAAEPAPVTYPRAMAPSTGVRAGADAPVTAPAPGSALAPGVSLAGVGPQCGASPTAAAAEALSAELAKARDGAGVATSFGGLAAWVREAAARGLWAGARLLVAALSALGALWPMWRRERGKGASQLSVRPSDDDVVAVAGPW